MDKNQPSVPMVGFMRVTTFINLAILMVCSIFVNSQAFGKIKIDGFLDEPEWRNAAVYSDFVTVVPLTSDPAKYGTEVRMITNEDGIFVGFSNYQPASVRRIRRQFARDSDIDADRNIVGVDFDGASMAAYFFVVGSSNSKEDGINSNRDYSRSWDGTWYSQTREEGDYWYTEIQIPWSTAPMSKPSGGRKKIAVWFSRVVYDESLRFAYPNAYFTRANFLEDWQVVEIDYVEKSNLDLFPYISYSNQLRDESNIDSVNEFKSGLDIVWRPNASTQLTGAVNPDFGQVESDKLVVNFSAFETFVSEKRPFFYENQSLFNSSLPNDDEILYTRRIGAGNEEGLMDIDFAVKATHFGSTTDTGLFIVKEGNSGGRSGGEFLSSRIQKKIDNLTIGHRLTYADQPELGREAKVNVLDLEWKKGNEARLRGEILHSDVLQSPDLSSGVNEIDDQDFAAWTTLSYMPSDEWKHRLKMFYYGDSFDINDLGFMKRNDYQQFSGSSRHNRLQYEDESSILSSSTKVEFGYSENTAGYRLEGWIGLENEWNFRSTRSIEMNYGWFSSGWDDRITRGNGIAAYSAGYWANIEYSSPRGNDFNYFAGVETEYNPDQKFSFRLTFAPEIYLTETFTIGSFFGYGSKQEWIIWDSELNQLAGYDAAFFEMSLGLDWYPSNRHEVRVKFQWVGIDAEAVNGYLLNDSGRRIVSPIPSPHFSLSDTALQIRYRYEIAPLSNIYLVYSRGGYFESQSGREGPGRLLREGWDDVQIEAIIAKIRYRF